MTGKNMLATDIEKALANENLRRALGRFGDDYLAAREKAYAGKNFAELRREIVSIKQDAARRMEELAGRFTRAATARGAKVFRAKNAAQAREYIKKLAEEKGVKRIVKSKSMATEEIHLNEFLQEYGYEAVETDLGEWILQLCGQKPSHMVMPAIHMTREEVAQIFSRETREELAAKIPRLVKVAREQLRKKFLTAEMGITGANIAVAETGTLVIVTNEGNGRLTTTLPPVHVAVVGLEKLVADFAAVRPILEALPRSATAQKITSYVSMITGPVPVVLPDGSVQDKELHIVLLDNGRTEMQQDPVFKEALQCIRCASCLNVCPVFQLLGGHVFGYVYTGGIGTILTAFFNGFANAGDVQNLCLGCERCKDFCPGQIDIPKLIRELRSRVVEQKGLPGTVKFVLEKVLPNRKLFHRLLKTARTVQKPFTKGGMARHLPLFLAGFTEGRSLPALADIPLRDKVKEFTRPQAAKTKVGFFAGCLTDFVYPQLGEAAHKVLGKMDMELVFPPEQTCCGIPAVYMGSRRAAAELARQNIEAFARAGVDHVITCCPTCAKALKQQYVELLAGDPAWQKQAENLAAKVSTFAEFITRQAEKGAGLSFKQDQAKVTYHDSCHMKSLGITAQPRELLQTAGLELVEMKNPDRCCGFGGSYSFKFPEISRQLLGRKLQAIEETGADLLALDCPGCLLQLTGGLESRGKKMPVKHTVEILAELVPDS